MHALHAPEYAGRVDILTIRNLDPEVKAKLRERAARHGRSMEAEARAVIAAAVDAPIATDVVSAIDHHFGAAPTELELPDRSVGAQRPIDFG